MSTLSINVDTIKGCPMGRGSSVEIALEDLKKRILQESHIRVSISLTDEQQDNTFIPAILKEQSA